jgi:S1-C subfamily serine protease
VRPSVIGRRAVSIDGALVAPIAFEDMAALSEAARLLVQSVEPGSAAEGLDIGPTDIIESIDGRRFGDLDALLAYLRQHQAGAPLRVVFRRFSESANSWFEFHVRDLPGQQIRVIEPEAQLLTSPP